MSELRAGEIAVAADDVDPDALRRILDARDRLAASHGIVSAPAATEPVLQVLIAGERLALPLASVAAVTVPATVTALPGGPPSLLGLFAHQGALHSLFAAEAALAITPARPDRMVAVVLRGPGPRIALAVEAALEVTHVLADGPAEPALVRLARTLAGAPLRLVDPALLLPALGVRAGPAKG